MHVCICVYAPTNCFCCLETLVCHIFVGWVGLMRVQEQAHEWFMTCSKDELSYVYLRTSVMFLGVDWLGVGWLNIG